jgi:aminoglycoside phosphotransferase (APT) family kinase protein
MQGLEVRVAAFIKETFGANAQLESFAPLTGGACQENFRLVVKHGGVGTASTTWVLRSDAAHSLAGSIDRAREFRVIEAAVLAGVQTPNACALTHSLVREGAYAYLLTWAEGDAIGRKIVKAPELERARASLGAALGTQLAKIHSITKSAALQTPEGLGTLPANPVQASLALQRARIDALKNQRLGTELIYRWLCDNAPTVPDVVLVHGDFRTGNFLVTPDGLSAILDWEFARWGSRYEDLAWISLRDWRFGVLGKPVGGFSDRAPFYEAYERASSHAVDLALVHYYEVLGNLAWAVGSIAQAERYLVGGEKDIELLAIGRRAAEMEWEALRLIERGKV